MKKKVVGIIILMLVIVTLAPVVTSLKNSVDVPVWKKGDSWTYNYHETVYYYDINGTLWFQLDHNCIFTDEVTDDTGDNYTLKWTSTNYKGNATIGLFRFKFTPFTKYSGEFVIRKTDLATLSETDQEKGFAFWLIGKIGFPIPTQYKHFRQWTYTPAWVTLPFPMTAGESGTFPGFTFTRQENCYLYWGLVKLFDWPVISYTYSPIGYHCEMENITTPAGSYDSYNVSVELTYGLGHYFCWRYYVPEVGNLAKIHFNSDWDTNGNPGTIFEYELVSTTYKL